MSAVLVNGYWEYDDGTRLKAISGAQELPEVTDASSFVTATNMDFVASWSPNQGDLYVDIGGVPYGDAEAAGYVGLSDAVRSGMSGDAYIGTTATNSSLSDILRTYGPEGSASGEQPGFTATDFGTGPAGAEGLKITDVFDIITKSLSTAAGIAFAGLAASKAGSANPGAPTGSAGAAPSVAQRLFGGYLPGASGNPVLPGSNSMSFVLIAVLGGLLIFFLARSR